MNKVRLDYARGAVDFYIDSSKFTVRLVEDLEFGLAEDACLVEYEADNISHCSEPAGLDVNEPLVDTLVDQLQEEWSKGSKHVFEERKKKGE